MSQPRDPYAVDAYPNYRPIAAAAQGYAQQGQQGQHYTAMPQDSPRMHQNASHTYRTQERYHTATSHDAPGYPQTASSHRAYQGSRSDTQQYEESVDPRYEVNFAGYQHQLDDRRQRTASFVQYRQRHHPGARYPPSPIEAERSGIRYGVNSITSFNNQFSRTADINASPQYVQRGDGSLAYAQSNNLSHASYPSYIEYPSQGDRSSPTRRREDSA